MRSEPDVDALLSVSTLDAPLIRRLIAIVTLATGLSGLLLIPSGALRPGWSWVPVLFAVACLVVAAVWLLPSEPPHWKAAFVVFSDVGIVIILCGFTEAFVAMPGVALLFVVSLFAAVYTSSRLLFAHTGLAVVVAVVFAAVSVAEGVDATLVASRTLTILSASVAPLAMRLYIATLRRDLQKSHTDLLTGLLTTRGLDQALRDIRGEDTTLGIELVQVFDPNSATNPVERSAMGDAIAELATGLSRVANPNTVLARIGTTELACVAWGRRATVTESLDRIAVEVSETSLRSARVTVRSVSALGAASDGAGQAFQGLLAGARLDVQARRLRDRSETDQLPHSMIRSIIEAGGPRIVYQPICSTTDDSVIGYEALSRFPAGFGSTQAWFTAAAETGQSAALELTAIELAIAGAHSLPSGVFLSLNASATTILTTDLPIMLASIVPPRRLIVELTEHDMVVDYAALGHAVSMLRTAGVGISVDDVGSGYAGLRHVVEVRPDIIKLDASIVSGIDDDPVRRAAAKSIVGLASEIGADTVFEGVETAAELGAARALGATMVQGFFLGRPRSFDATAAS
ncbi:EAL domain-containing protein [Rhodococcoides trifolii]|nr:EAL domain-containing protein [Rhodococcus trifolii]